MYTETDLVRIAKRENNKKRSYLVVNSLQGKHIPTFPSEAFKMFHELAELLNKAYPLEKLLLMGFAETATAIGSALAIELNSYYMQTTRENIEGVSYLYFSESHSHATEQKVVKDDIDKIICEIDRIVFVEDEVTTGNTILNITQIIENQYSKQVNFSVASLLNGMNKESEKIYQEKNIELHYLIKTNHDEYEKKAEKHKGNGIYNELNYSSKKNIGLIKSLKADGYMDARRQIIGSDYEKACNRLWKQVLASIDSCEEKESNQCSTVKKILVIGTEEFMYPALYIAWKMESIRNKMQSEKYTVRCHSTTRSPIVVSSESEYPLHNRYELRSFYDDERITYIYNLEKYDKVFIVTDSGSENKKGLSSLLYALELSGNKEVNVIWWN